MTDLRIGAIEYGDHAEPAIIDLDAYEQQGLRVGIFAASGSGKGWLLGVLLEEFIAQTTYPIICIDPESELWTFQEAGALVLGGPHGDAPLPRSDAGIRKAIEFGLAGYRPIVFDLGGIRGAANLLREGERISNILWDVADTARQNIVFAVTEAEVFAPQQVPKTGPAPEMLATITKRGRKRGIISLLETQRPADIANAVITQCNVRLIGRMDDTSDYDRIKRYVAPATFTQMHRLATGTFMLDGLEVLVRGRNVTHGGGTPIGGEIAIAKRATEGLAEIIAALREPEPEPRSSDPGVDPATFHAIVASGQRAAEQRASRAEAGLATALDDLRAQDGRIASLERQVGDLRPMAEVAGQLRKALIALIGEQIVAPDRAAGLVEEDIIALIRLHAPTGGASAPALLPVEALRARYLEAAAQRLVEAVEALEADSREALLFLLSQPEENFSITAIAKALSGNDSGGARERWGKAVLPLVKAGLARHAGSGKMARQQDVDAWVASALGPHNPSTAEVAQVKSRALSVVMSR